MIAKNSPMRRVVMPLLFALIPASLAIAQEPAGPKPAAVDDVTYFLLRADDLPLSDASPFNHQIISNQVKLVPGRFGNAVEPGPHSYLMSTMNHNYQSLLEMTASCWVKWDGTAGSQQIVGRAGMWELSINGQNKLAWSVTNEAGQTASVDAPLPANQWVHLAGTFDGHAVRLFINEQLAGEAPLTGRIRSRPSRLAPLCIGAVTPSPKLPLYLRQQLQARLASPTHVFHGQIDEIRITGAAERPDGGTSSLARPATPSTMLEPVPWSGEFKPAEAPELTVTRATSTPVIDGELNDDVWQALPHYSFVDAKTAGRANVQTTFQICYDGTNLYLAFNASESGQEMQVEGPATHDDPALFRADAVEVFLQPGGVGAPYYQIAVNPKGGVYDARITPGESSDKQWQAEGLRINGATVPDRFRVELAIPFASLGVKPPKPGDAWRANFGRTEQPSGALAAWAPAEGSGSFHAANRYGTLRFSKDAPLPNMNKNEIATPAAINCELWGRVLDANDKPVHNLLVHSDTQNVRTDAMGRFHMTEIPAGDLRIEFSSPAYEPLAGMVTLKQKTESMRPVHLNAIDPYHLKTAQSSFLAPGPVTWFESNMMDPPAMDQPLTEADQATKLSIIAARGEWTSRAVALMAGESLASPGVTLEPLIGPNNQTLSPAAVQAEIRWTQRLPMRRQVNSTPEDSVYAWWFLRHEAPKNIERNQLRQLVLTIHIPDNVPAGDYKSKLIFQSDSRTVSSLPVLVHVPDFELATPKKQVGCYYSVCDSDDATVDRMLKDIREHGCSLVLPYDARVDYHRNGEPDLYAVQYVVDKLVQHNLDSKLIVMPNVGQAINLSNARRENSLAGAKAMIANEKFRTLIANGLASLENLNKSYGDNQFIYVWMDEIANDGRHFTWIEAAKFIESHCDNQAFVTLHNRDPQVVKQVSPYLGIRCYHGHVMDDWLQSHHNFDELEADLEKTGNTAWVYYNPRDASITPKWMRLANGQFLWNSPFQVHIPWNYYDNREYGDPMDPLAYKDYPFGVSLTAPDATKPEYMSTLRWECFREGYNDLCYLTTLEEAVKHASRLAPDSPQVAEARQWLEDAHSEVLPVKALATIWSGKQLLARKQHIAMLIESLQPLIRQQ